MGLSGSKEEKYKLRVIDSDVEDNEFKTQLSQGYIQRSNSIVPQKSAKIHPTMDSSNSPSSSMLRKTISSGKIDRSISPTQPSFIQTFCSAEYAWLVKSSTMNSISNEDFEAGRVIGTGLMGMVRVYRLKTKRQYFAVKCIRKDYILRHHDERHIQNEREIMLNLSSPFCIKLFGTFQDQHYVYYVMELAIGGELFRRLSKKEAFQPQTAKFYATEIFSALEHIQSLGYVYRDLKPENVMLDEEGHCKLVDFGFSRECGPDEMMQTVCGTPAYLSPEQLNGKFTNGYTRIVDWWSFGVFVYELLTGKTPFCRSNKESSYEIYLRILNSKVYFPRNFDATSKELISALCHHDIKKRLCDPQKIKTHPYFVIDWNDVKKKKMVPPFVPKIKEEIDLHYFDDYGEPPTLKEVAAEQRYNFENF